MKSIATELLAEYNKTGTKLVYCILITRADGIVLGFTSTDHDIIVLGQLYKPGLDVQSIVHNSGLSVNNLNISSLYDSEDFIREDFLAGKWASAKWELFETSWENPDVGTNTIGFYVTGNVTPKELSCSIELRALSQYLQQPLGQVTSKTCRARFADYPSQIQSAVCGLSASDRIHVGAITAVASQVAASCDTLPATDDLFGEGFLKFNSGFNSGLSQKIKSYDSSGNFIFSLPFPFAIEIDDEFEVIEGCRKRIIDDCKNKFDNVLNFQGEPYLPGPDKVLAT